MISALRGRTGPATVEVLLAEVDGRSSIFP
jgi:hypothetical protein